MRILFWSETYWPRRGGVERLADALTLELRDRGHDLAVVTWCDDEKSQPIERHGIPIFGIPFFRPAGRNRAAPTLAQLEQVARLKRDFRPDVVHINSYGRSAWFHVATRQAHRAPELLSLHAAPPPEARSVDTLAAALFGTAGRIACCSDYVRRATAQVLPTAETRLRTVRNALPTPPEPTREPQLGAKLVFVGRLVADKGLDWLLPALPRLFARFPHARLDVIGDGPLRSDLEAQAGRLGVLSHLRFAGALPAESVPLRLETASIVVVPSRAESFGLVALEAAFAARPVVATEVGGLPEVVQHESTGLLADPTNPGKFVASIASLLEHEQRARRFGAAARARALAEFRWRDYVDTYEHLYESLAHRSRPQAAAAAASQPGD